MTEFYAHVEAVAEILRTHQYDDGGQPERWPDRCFCGTPMGDQEQHQAIAIVEAGWAPPSGEVSLVIEPDHTCTPPDPGNGPVVTSYTCTCGQTWLLHRVEDGPDEWRPVTPEWS